MKLPIINSFYSDNGSVAHESVLEVFTNMEIKSVLPYGNDHYTKVAISKFKEHFNDDVSVFFVANGTAANVLSITSLVEPYHSIICTEISHLHTAECGALEKQSGCKIISVKSEKGKLTIENIKREILNAASEHQNKPKLISITQPTEIGTVYTTEEIKTISDFAHDNNMILHMDGARLSNAAVFLEKSLKELTMETNIDVLSFGGAKNGLIIGEAIVFFNKKHAEEFKYVQKQGLQLISKMRYISIQFIPYLTKDLWKNNAKNANQMAIYLAENIEKLPHMEVLYPVEANLLFICIPNNMIHQLQKKYNFLIRKRGESHSVIRLVTSYNTTEEEVNDLIKEIKKVTHFIS